MQIDDTKLIFVMNLSVLDFFKFASKMPQIAQIFVLTFKIFHWGHAPHPLRNFLIFFISNSRLCLVDMAVQVFQLVLQLQHGVHGVRVISSMETFCLKLMLNLLCTTDIQKRELFLDDFVKYMVCLHLGAF